MKVRLKTLLNKPRGGAWPSSARAVKCPVKSGNERDLHLQLPAAEFQDWAHCKDCLGNKEEGSGNDRSVCPQILWATRAQQWYGQWDATPKGEAKPLNHIPVQIEGCNSPS